MNDYKEGDLIILPIKNRWGLDCAATVIRSYDEFVDATVWNMNGPGADREITKIPIEVIIKD
jgi:hypothetical protein